MSEDINYQELYEALLKEYDVLFDKYENLRLKYYGTIEAANYHERDRAVMDKKSYNHWHLDLE